MPLAVNPPDPYFNNQWNLTGNNSININPAWRISKGSSNVTIGISEAYGFNYNTNEFTGRVHEYSYGGSFHYGYHGATVAYIACASHNDIGIAGVAPNCKLMTINIVNTTSLTIPESILNAYKNGADVINCSWKYKDDEARNLLFEEACAEAFQYGRNGKGTLIVFAAGNDGIISVPAKFISDAIIVGATDNSGKVASFSGKGEELTICAPGENVFCLNEDGNYGNNSGTSFAAPQVSGLAALILSIRPELTAAQVKQLIIETSSRSSHSNDYGWGIINAGNAMLAANEDYSISSNSDIIYPTNGLLTFYLYNVPRGASVSWSSEKGSGPYSASHKSASFRYPTNTTTPIKETITVTISYLGRTKTIKYPCTIYMATQISAITKLEDFPDNDYYVHLQAHCSKNNAPVEWSIYSSNGYQFNLMDFMYEGDASYIDNPKAYATLQIGNGMSGIMDQIPEGAYCKIEVRVNEPGGDQRFCTVIRQGGTWIVRDDGMSPMSLKEEKEAIE